MNVENVSIGLLRPYWRNPRNIEEAVDAVTESIRQYGYNSPIVVDEDYTIIVGHTRYRALQRLGYEKVDVVVSNLPPKIAREYRVADNKSGEISYWDEDKLIEEIMSLEDPGFAKSYFSEDELYGLLGEASPAIEVEEYEDPVAPTEEEPKGPAPSEEEGEMLESGAEVTGVYVTVVCPECGEDTDVWIDRA